MVLVAGSKMKSELAEVCVVALAFLPYGNMRFDGFDIDHPGQHLGRRSARRLRSVLSFRAAPAQRRVFILEAVDTGSIIPREAIADAERTEHEKRALKYRLMAEELRAAP
jgi:hypothetical protein